VAGSYGCTVRGGNQHAGNQLEVFVSRLRRRTATLRQGVGAASGTGTGAGTGTGIRGGAGGATGLAAVGGIGGTPPTQVTGLAAGTITGNSVALTWNAATDNVGVTGYRVQRATNSGFTTGVVTFLPGNVLATTVTGLSASTAYWFRVQAFDAEGNNGPYSASVSATTQASSGMVWPTQDVAAFLSSYGKPPIIPNAPCHGANQFGGSGRHLGTPQTYVLFVDRLSTSAVGGSSAGSTNGSLDTTNRVGYGSLTWCLNRNVPRVVVPLVSGLIDYGGSGTNTVFQITNPYLTYAGQCAPSPGLYAINLAIVSGLFSPSGASFTKHHVFWHMGLFAGHDGAGNGSTGTPFNPTGIGTLFANCSTMWQKDEGFVLGQSNSGEATSWTSAWQCLAAEGLGNSVNNTIYPNTTGHGYFIDSQGSNTSMLRSASIFNNQRSPLIRSGVTVANNIVGQWFTSAAELYGNADVNLEANLYVWWPTGLSPSYNQPYFKSIHRTDSSWTGRLWAPTNSHASLGNRTLFPASPTTSDADLFSGTLTGTQTGRLTGVYPSGFVPFSLGNASTDNRQDFAGLVLDSVGPRPADRLAVIQRVITRFKNRLAGSSPVGPPPQWGGSTGVDEVLALVPSVAQNTITNPFSTQSAWNGAAVPAVSSRDSVYGSGTFSDGVSRVGYTALEEFIYERHLQVMV